jgi:hypothetical protein
MASARSRDSHIGGGILDHSIRGPSPLLYHLSFMVELARGSRLGLRTAYSKTLAIHASFLKEISVLRS